MPRYFFNMMEGRSQNLVRDIDGILLADASKAREEAIGLAQDISSHGLAESMKSWTVVVTESATRLMRATSLVVVQLLMSESTSRIACWAASASRALAAESDVTSVTFTYVPMAWMG